jgi:hypothetical protein
MKKLFFSALSILFSGILNSQIITITKADMPVAGDSFKYATVLPLGANLTLNSTGPNTSWNYTGLKKNDSTVVNYEKSSKTPYAFYFFNTMGLKIADNLGFGQFTFTDVYSFYKTSTTDFTAEGIGFMFSGFPLGGFYTDKDEIYHFPLTYGDKDSANFKVSIQLPGIGNYKQTGKRINNVDGWGQITLPGGASYKCLRIKSVINQIDSVSVSQPFPLAFGFPSTRVEYKWLTNDDKVPVLEVSGTELFGSFTPATIRYRESFKPTDTTGGGGGPGLHVDDAGKQVPLKVYPNPATTTLTITTNQNAVVKLFDMNGREVNIKTTPTVNGLEIDTQNIAAGFYMLFVKTNGDMVWEKVEISR